MAPSAFCVLGFLAFEKTIKSASVLSIKESHFGTEEMLRFERVFICMGLT